jgi:NADH-quinone oxidoreductase subunit N
MNLGAFGVVIAVARKTRSGEISSYGGLINYAPGLTVVMTAFLFSLAGIPPLGGWFAKFYVFKSIGEANTPAGWVLGVIVAINSVIALVYYANVARQMWMSPVPDEDRTPIRVPAALATSMGICVVVVVALGVYPQAFARLGDLAHLAR